MVGTSLCEYFFTLFPNIWHLTTLAGVIEDKILMWSRFRWNLFILLMIQNWIEINWNNRKGILSSYDKKVCICGTSPSASQARFGDKQHKSIQFKSTWRYCKSHMIRGLIYDDIHLFWKENCVLIFSCFNHKVLQVWNHQWFHLLNPTNWLVLLPTMKD